jgi:hypothetical protein
MTTYIFYDRRSGEIVHIHREYYMASEGPADVSEDALSAELRDLLPAARDIGVLKTQDHAHPVRGYRYCVDPTTHSLALVEAPRPKRERRQ